MAGVHGDEFEGQVALSRLAHELHPDMLEGQVILLPMANYPAAQEGTRTSPVDGVNLNRVFPGAPDGLPTYAIAHFIESELLTRADYLLDIHSGGSSLRYNTTLLMADHPDPDQQREALSLLNCFEFSKALLHPASLDGGYSSSAARRNGVIGITVEVAGGGNVEQLPLQKLESGIRRFLHAVGVLKQAYAPADTGWQVPLMSVSDDCYVYAMEDGLFEPIMDVDQAVTAGQVGGYIHHPETPWRPPDPVRFSIDATIVCVRVPARTERGDCLFELAVPLSR